MSDPSAPALDTSLLRGFGFACRPDCGLCCFATPRATRSELAALVARRPDLEVIDDGSERLLAARPRGGACQLLTELRCSAHDLRPHPCREFPLTVHVGSRLQVDVVLSCPGVNLAGLTAADARPDGGFAAELESVHSRLGPRSVRAIDEAVRRRRKVARVLTEAGRWVEEDAVRASLADRLPWPRDSNFEALELPEADGPLESLPMFFEGGGGPVALGDHVGGWEAIRLQESGGGRPMNVIPPVDRAPPVAPSGRARLREYQGYVLRRDSFLATVVLETLDTEEGTVADRARTDLERLGATVLARAAFRARLAGAPDRPLERDDVDRGIRATDAEWLDRPTWGSRL